MPYPICRHIRTNGLQCQSPTLTGGHYCFFHTRLHERHRAYRLPANAKGYLIPGEHIELAPLEDGESIQVALSVVINALATGGLEPRRATALLYGLSLASANARRLQEPILNQVRDAQQTTDGLNLAQPEPQAKTTAAEASLGDT